MFYSMNSVLTASQVGTQQKKFIERTAFHRGDDPLSASKQNRYEIVKKTKYMITMQIKFC